jgi:glycosyltransferase involved in cell wall biosynthesis
MESNTNPLAGRRLVIVEEALKNHCGHWYEYDKAVYDIDTAAGVDVTIAAHRSAEPSICRELNAVPLFAYTNWDNIYNHPEAWRRYLGVFLHNVRVYRTMNRFLREAEPFDCVFVPTVVIFHLMAWRALLARYRGRRFQRLVLLIRNNAGSYRKESHIPVFKRSTHILKWILQSFSSHVKSGHVVFASDSARLAAEYRQLCGLDFEVFPHPVTQFLDRTEKSENAPVTFSCLGPARIEKGIDVLQAAIRKVFDRAPQLDVRFVIQWNVPIIVGAGGAVLAPDPQLAADRRVTIIGRDLDSAAYSRLIIETDCMILPYRRESYFARISGVAVEAMTAGIPILYTRDTWMADAVSRMGAGLAVEDGDANDLASKVIALAGEIAAFKRRAVAQTKIARQYYSPDQFLEKLWGSAWRANLGEVPASKHPQLPLESQDKNSLLMENVRLTMQIPLRTLID